MEQQGARSGLSLATSAVFEPLQPWPQAGPSHSGSVSCRDSFHEGHSFLLTGGKTKGPQMG